MKDDQLSDYQVIPPGHELRTDWYKRFENFLWKEDRVCRMGRGVLALGAVVFPLINIVLLLVLINK